MLQEKLYTVYTVYKHDHLGDTLRPEEPALVTNTRTNNIQDLVIGVQVTKWDGSCISPRHVKIWQPHTQRPTC